MGAEKSQNVQDVFLNKVRKEKMPVTVFLVNGVKLQGAISWFDNFSVLLRQDGHEQLGYKHAISTVMPAGPIQLFDPSADGRRNCRRRGFDSGMDEPSEREGIRPGEGPLVRPPYLRKPTDNRLRVPSGRLEEAVSLTAAIALDVVHAEIVPLAKAKPGTLFGEGKIDELGEFIRNSEIDVVIIDGPVTPVQQRNLERSWQVKIVDRTGLIIEIFGERAQTREGALQVELAHLSYQRTRLVRSWTHLERQRGSLSFIGGPGESQLELDRRLIDERITKLKRQLATVVQTRELHRAKRKRVPYPIVALVGYTNAGKSTLFNRMTAADVYAEDLLFAT